ncbi:MAG: hypothetical protein EOP22_14240 [Hyphomicrobiales bacterium]|nr:MAG: hypothetical protein EOP22_14240 [Hyphomicrobiales bacterium]
MLALAGLAGMSGAPQAASALPQIQLTSENGTLMLTASVLALAGASGTAELRVSRSGAGGEMNTTQSQPFDLAAGETVIVARLGLSMAPGDRLVVEAILRSGDIVISTARLESNGAGQQ